MRAAKTGLFLLLIGLFQVAAAQGVYISRYIPGNYLSDNDHRVEIYNPSGAAADLEGYLLVTRDYSVRLPSRSRVAPRSVLRIAKQPAPGVTLNLSTTPDFLIRFHFLEHEGNYVVLFDKEMNIVDAMYYSPVPNVPFLPDRDTSYTFAREKLPFYLPPENRRVWTYISVGNSPTNAFVQSNGEWRLSAQRSDENPATAHDDLSVRFSDGIVAVKWATRFEKDCRFHAIERSEDQENFRVVGQLDSKGNSQDFQRYTFYEKDLEPGGVYYYRVRSEDLYGNRVYSKIREIKAEAGDDEFSMEVFVGMQQEGDELNLRFISRYSQRVRIKLYDERRREVAILYNDYVFAETPTLLKI